MDERHVTDPASATLLQDAFFDPRGGWEVCGGTAKILLNVQGTVGDVSPFAGQGAIDSMFWFSQHNGAQQFLLWEMNGNLVYFDGAQKSWITIATGRYQTSTPWQRTQYAAMGNSVWIINGEDAPIRFDGRTASPAGFAGPAPSLDVGCVSEGIMVGTTYAQLGLGIAATADFDGQGQYAYMATELNEDGNESPPTPVASAVSWTIAADASYAGVTQPKYMARVTIPKASAEHVVGHNLYRSMNGSGGGLQDGSRLYFVGEYMGSNEQIVLDFHPDGTLTRELDQTQLGEWPRGAKYIAIHKGRIWLAGMPDYPDTVVYSRADQIEVFPPANRFRMGENDSGEVTGMRGARNALWVFKRHGVHAIMPDQSGGWHDKIITRDVGCCAPNSIQDVPGVGTVFLSENGLWALSGSIQEGDTPATIIPFSDALVDFWKWRVCKPALMNAWGAVHHEDKEYWLSVPIDGQARNRMVLVYHYGVPGGAWSMRPDMNVACMAETHDHRGYLFLGSNDDTDHPGVHLYSHGFPDKDGVAKDFVYQSSNLDLASVYQHVHPKGVRVRMLTYGTNQIALTTYKDRIPIASGASAVGRKQVDADYTAGNTAVLPVWGTAQWDASAKWGRAAPTVVRWDVDMNGAKEIQYKLQIATRCQILGASLEITPSEMRNEADANAIIGTGTEP